MDKNWEPQLKSKVNLANSQKRKKFALEYYFDEPNFKITLIQ
jgi:hypothetical protein